MNKVLERLADKAWFLEYDGHRYRFKTEPSVNKIIADETVQVGPSKAKLEIEGRIRQIWKKGYFKPVYFPVEAADVDDDADLPKLAIMHFDARESQGRTMPAPPRPGAQDRGLRGHAGLYRALPEQRGLPCAGRDQVENMVEVARRYLAIGRIMGDGGRMGGVQQRAAGQAAQNARRRRAGRADRHHQGLPLSVLPDHRRAEDPCLPAPRDAARPGPGRR